MIYAITVRSPHSGQIVVFIIADFEEVKQMIVTLEEDEIPYEVGHVTGLDNLGLVLR